MGLAAGPAHCSRKHNEVNNIGHGLVARRGDLAYFSHKQVPIGAQEPRKHEPSPQQHVRKAARGGAERRHVTQATGSSFMLLNTLFDKELRVKAKRTTASLATLAAPAASSAASASSS